MASWWKGNLMKWQVEEIAGWWNDKLTKRDVDVISIGWNDIWWNCKLIKW